MVWSISSPKGKKKLQLTLKPPETLLQNRRAANEKNTGTIVLVPEVDGTKQTTDSLWRFIPLFTLRLRGVNLWQMPEQFPVAPVAAYEWEIAWTILHIRASSTVIPSVFICQLMKYIVATEKKALLYLYLALVGLDFPLFCILFNTSTTSTTLTSSSTSCQ